MILFRDVLFILYISLHVVAVQMRCIQALYSEKMSKYIYKQAIARESSVAQ